jgi:histidinol-phosphate phosphatase family protein
MSDVRRRAVFLDRDGVIIEDTGYLRDPSEVRLMPGAGACLRRLDEAGFELILVSNQSGVGRGLITRAQATAVHDATVAALADAGVGLSACYYCFHAPAEACACRKPSPAMIEAAAAERNLETAACFLIGDRSTDIEAGQRAGCRTIGFAADADHDFRPGVPDAVATDWPSAVAAVVELAAKQPSARS